MCMTVIYVRLQHSELTQQSISSIRQKGLQNESWHVVFGLGRNFMIIEELFVFSIFEIKLRIASFHSGHFIAWSKSKIHIRQSLRLDICLQPAYLKFLKV